MSNMEAAAQAACHLALEQAEYILTLLNLHPPSPFWPLALAHAGALRNCAPQHHDKPD